MTLWEQGGSVRVRDMPSHSPAPSSGWSQEQALPTSLPSPVCLGREEGREHLGPVHVCVCMSARTQPGSYLTSGGRCMALPQAGEGEVAVIPKHDARQEPEDLEGEGVSVPFINYFTDSGWG